MESSEGPPDPAIALEETLAGATRPVMTQLIARLRDGCFRRCGEDLQI
jgi:hypothetical protein